MNPTCPSGCTIGQVRRSLGKAVSEGVNPASLAGYGGTSLQSETARASHMVDASCQTKQALKLCIAVQCDIIKEGETEYLRAASAHAERHINANEHFQVDLASDIDEFKTQVRAEREVSEGLMDELLQLKKERLSALKKVLDQNS